jgi:hypothetical protein
METLTDKQKAQAVERVLSGAKRCEHRVMRKRLTWDERRQGKLPFGPCHRDAVWRSSKSGKNICTQHAYLRRHRALNFVYLATGQIVDGTKVAMRRVLNAQS